MRVLTLGHTRVLVVAALVAAVLACTCPGMADASSRALKKGMRGDDVVRLQQGLANLGFYSGECDGLFGDRTLQAVEAFQRQHGLRVDGVVGASTWERLEAELRKGRTKTYVVSPGDSLWAIARKFGVGVQDIVRANDIRDASSIRAGQELRIPGAGDIPSRGGRSPVEVLHWDKVKSLFRSYATVVDVRTGLSFRVRRRGGHFHADAEPVSAEDTAIMKRIYGGRWSWERRPIVVEVAGRRIAASMNGMPHGGESVRGNDFPGHFCIHFAGSRLHGSGEMDREHQACVREAAASK
ncbi:MAG: peptidoglycan-binding protein [Firmicutes bacterium]|nr:peptidoglycan-binding protein [Bacillota bacterium]